MKNYSHVLLLFLFSVVTYNSNAQSYKRLVKSAYKYYYKNDLDAAEDLYNKALEIKPDAEHCFYSIARIYSEREKYDTALILVNKAIELFPYDIYYYELRARLYYKLYKEKEALQDIEAFLLNNEFKNDTIYMIALRAECNYELGNYKEALDDYKWTLSNVSKERWENFCATCYTMKTASCYLELSDYGNALKYYNSAINVTDCDRKYVCQSLIGRAKIYAATGKKEESLKEFTTAIECIDELDDERIDSASLPIIYAYMGNEKDAVDLINAQIENDKTNPRLQSDDYYYLGCIYAVLGKKELALQNLEKSLHLLPGQSVFMRTDIDLKNIIGSPEFTTLISKYATKE